MTPITSRGPLRVSVASGFGWAVIGLLVAFAGGLFSVPSRLGTVSVAGGILVSPFIGLLMGMVSKTFGTLPIVIRIVVAGVSLYIATLLFVIADNVFLSILMGRMIPNIWFNSVMVAWAALLLTWFFVVLWPLAYANHALVARAWARSEASNA